MTNNTQLPAEVVHRILKCRDALVMGDRDEAYHQLYAIASPKFDKYFPWDEMEKQISYPKFSEEELKANREVTEYASKLHLEQQAHEETRQSFKKQLNDRLQKAQQEIESLTNQLKNHSKVADGNMKLLRQENEKARTLLQKVVEKYSRLYEWNSGIFNEIKQFLDGKK